MVVAIEQLERQVRSEVWEKEVENEHEIHHGFAKSKQWQQSSVATSKPQQPSKNSIFIVQTLRNLIIMIIMWTGSRSAPVRILDPSRA